MARLFLNALFPMPYTGQGVAYTLSSLAKTMAGPDVDVKVFLPYLKRPIVSDVKFVQSLPFIPPSLPFRLVRPLANWKGERDFLAAIRKLPREQAVAYLWSELSWNVYQQLRDSRITIVREKINCAKASTKRILDDAYGRLGLSHQHAITDASIHKEFTELSCADHIFCPSPFVESTLMENGIPSSKFIPTSYGWEPNRFTGTHKLLAPSDGPTFVFVGTICVRKGAHLLLKYWQRSGIKGRLVLAGSIEPAIREQCADLLARPDVHCPGFVSDVGALYRSADVFIFPSLEESGPQVTYEAMGCGLPVLVSPMGGGRIVRDKLDGSIIEPYSEEAWVEAMREMAASSTIRATKGENARARAQEFTWERVGRQRTDALLSRVA